MTKIWRDYISDLTLSVQSSSRGADHELIFSGCIGAGRENVFNSWSVTSMYNVYIVQNEGLKKNDKEIYSPVAFMI